MPAHKSKPRIYGYMIFTSHIIEDSSFQEQEDLERIYMLTIYTERRWWVGWSRKIDRPSIFYLQRILQKVLIGYNLNSMNMRHKCRL